MKRLQDELDKMCESQVEMIPEDVAEDLHVAAEQLLEQGVLDHCLHAGDKAPQFVLHKQDGTELPLSELLNKGPVVITFYRGSWCSFCNTALKGWQEAVKAIQSTGATLIAVTPSACDRNPPQVDYETLCDSGNTIAKQFGIVFKMPRAMKRAYKYLKINISSYNADGSEELPVPATFVIDQEGIIKYAHVNLDFTRRAEPSDIIKLLEKL